VLMPTLLTEVSTGFSTIHKRKIFKTLGIKTKSLQLN
jgi:hypothetical protein